MNSYPQFPTYAALTALPNQCESDHNDLRVDLVFTPSFETVRFWTARGDEADGHPFPHTVYVEVRDYIGPNSRPTHYDLGHYDGDNPPTQLAGHALTDLIHPVQHPELARELESADDDTGPIVATAPAIDPNNNPSLMSDIAALRAMWYEATDNLGTERDDPTGCGDCIDNDNMCADHQRNALLSARFDKLLAKVEDDLRFVDDVRTRHAAWLADNDPDELDTAFSYAAYDEARTDFAMELLDRFTSMTHGPKFSLVWLSDDFDNMSIRVELDGMTYEYDASPPLLSEATDHHPNIAAWAALLARLGIDWYAEMTEVRSNVNMRDGRE